MRLTWGLVIATYNRGHILPRCLRLAAEQTRAPSEIIVIDASADWEETRERVMREIAAARPEIRWVYRRARRASSTFQRNEGIREATAEVLFLIDDDSLMYPDCAEETMRVYEADTAGAIAGVSPVGVAAAPDDASQVAQTSEGGAGNGGGSVVRRLVRRALRADDIFVPYDYRYPEHVIPAELAHLEIGLITAMHGARMTFRREAVAAEMFEEVLERYAAGEDSDTSYRVSRRGMLANAFRARLCHLEASGGRLSRFVVTALGAMNPAVLHRIYGADAARSKRLTRALLRRRLAIQLCKDLSKREWSLPHARGIWFALRTLDEIFAKTPEELRAWYPGFQKGLIERDVAAREAGAVAAVRREAAPAGEAAAR